MNRTNCGYCCKVGPKLASVWPCVRVAHRCPSSVHTQPCRHGETPHVPGADLSRAARVESGPATRQSRRSPVCRGNGRPVPVSRLGTGGPGAKDSVPESCWPPSGPRSVCNSITQLLKGGPTREHGAVTRLRGTVGNVSTAMPQSASHSSNSGRLTSLTRITTTPATASSAPTMVRRSSARRPFPAQCLWPLSQCLEGLFRVSTAVLRVQLLPPLTFSYPKELGLRQLTCPQAVLRALRPTLLRHVKHRGRPLGNRYKRLQALRAPAAVLLWISEHRCFPCHRPKRFSASRSQCLRQ